MSTTLVSARHTESTNPTGTNACAALAGTPAEQETHRERRVERGHLAAGVRIEHDRSNRRAIGTATAAGRSRPPRPRSARSAAVTAARRPPADVRGGVTHLGGDRGEHLRSGPGTSAGCTRTARVIASAGRARRGSPRSHRVRVQCATGTCGSSPSIRAERATRISSHVIRGSRRRVGESSRRPHHTLGGPSVGLSVTAPCPWRYRRREGHDIRSVPRRLASCDAASSGDAAQPRRAAARGGGHPVGARCPRRRPRRGGGVRPRHPSRGVALRGGAGRCGQRRRPDPGDLSARVPGAAVVRRPLQRPHLAAADRPPRLRRPRAGVDAPPPA